MASQGDTENKTGDTEATLASSLNELNSLFAQLMTYTEQESDADTDLTSQAMTYFRYKANRMAKSYFSGRCRYCNDLQPDGHEDSSTESHISLNPWGSMGRKDHLKESSQEARKIPSLFLDDIKLSQLLECRKRRTGTTGKEEWENNCRYCRLICDALDAIYFEGIWSRRDGSSSRSIELTIRKGFPLVVTTRNFTDWVPGPGYRDDVEIYIQSPGGQTCAPLKSDQPLEEAEPTSEGKKAAEVSSTDALMPSLGLATPRAASADSDECLGLVVECYADCIKNHPLCSQVDLEQPDFVPSRLVYVGGSNHDLRLCEHLKSDPDSQEALKWAALSHCWGGGRGIQQLTAASLDAMKVSIDHETLPATFKDAIRVVRLLKLKYLWIDSLCIIQDSRLDWEVEASQMGNVYTGAIVVVSAASSMNPTIPILRKREPWWSSHKLTFTDAEGISHEVFARRRQVWIGPVTEGLKKPRYTSSWAAAPQMKILQSRAWVFQEEFLARRNLFFELGSLVWKCKTHERTEGHLPPYPDLREGSLGEVHVDHKWRQIVKAYSARSLSFRSDRLPAISGVAALISQQKDRLWEEQHPNDDLLYPTYLAGLWRHSLLEDLLWATMPGSSHRPLAYPRNAFVAPTWSWASLHHGVVWTRFPGIEYLAKITAANVSLRDPAEGSTKPSNPYGEVTVGIVGIHARKLPCWITYNTDERSYYMHFDRSDGTESSKEWIRSDGLLRSIKIVRALPDGGQELFTGVRRAYPGENDEGLSALKARAWFVCLAKTSPSTFGHIGLVIGTSWPGTLLVRIAFASNLPAAWWEMGEPEQDIYLT